MAGFTFYVGKRQFDADGQEVGQQVTPIRGYVPGVANVVEAPFALPDNFDFVSEADREAGVTASTGASVTDAEMAEMRARRVG